MINFSPLYLMTGSGYSTIAAEIAGPVAHLDGLIYRANAVGLKLK